MIRRGVFAGLIAGLMVLCLGAIPAQAQYWAKRSVCDVETPQIHAEFFAPLTLDQAQARAALIPNPVGRFWRVTAPGGPVSHLWGTFHSDHPRILDLPDIVIDRIETARVLMIEYDPIAPTRRQVEIRQSRSDWWHPVRPPRDLEDAGVSPEIVGWIRSRLIGLGWGADAINYLKLAALGEILLADPCLDFGAGVLPIQDHRILMLARIAGVPTLGLEAYDALFRHLSADQDLARAFVQVLGSGLAPRKDNRALATSLQIYLSGQLALYDLWVQLGAQDYFGDERGLALDALVDGYLIDQRNVDFVAAALPELQQGGGFVAVGAAHLPGTAGMIELLRAAGFAVTRIPVPGELE